MRSIKRIKPFLQILEKAWETVPDWRFGQLVCNLQRAIQNDGFYIEDDQMLDVIKAYFNLNLNENEINKN